MTSVRRRHGVLQATNLTVTASSAVQALKDLVSHHFRSPNTGQMLRHDGKSLDKDHLTLKDYNIQQGSRIFADWESRSDNGDNRSVNGTGV